MGHLDFFVQHFGGRLVVGLMEVAPLIGWHPQTIRNQLSRGRCDIPIRKVGGKLMISIVDLAGWLDSTQSPQTTPTAAPTLPPTPAAKRKPGRPKKSSAGG